MHVEVSEAGMQRSTEVEWCQCGSSGRLVVTLFNISHPLCFFAGGQCGCSSYSTLLYALSSAVAVLLLLLLLVGFVVVCRVSGLNVAYNDVL